jgi:hypothetical protein
MGFSISDDKTMVAVYLAEPDDEFHYVVDLDSSKEIVLSEGESQFNWTLHDGGSYKQVNHAQVYKVLPEGEREFSGEIQLYRVSEEEGEEHLRVQREDGWVFVGRCTYDLVSPSEDGCLVRTEEQVLTSLTLSERMEIQALLSDFSVGKRPYGSTQEMIESLGDLLTYMCAHGLRNITGANNAEIYRRCPARAVKGVQRGEIGVQCQGIRSLFTWVAISTGLLGTDQIREVDGYRYEPISGVDVNSHAILEIRRPEGGWFAFDPLAQVVFTDDTGIYLSAEQIRCLRENDDLKRIIVVELANFCVSGDVSYFAEQDGGYWAGFDFSDVDPFNYNYWCHFNRLVVRSLHLPD